ncbi:MAG: hypothetical protein JWL84_727 [Rhodospirillales bacterium]|jgi:hypothetical protein|nr:hypothetical protein [Rhodospirillales bacterium]
MLKPLVIFLSLVAAPAAAAGWDKAQWGMTASQLAAAYGASAHVLQPPIEFGDSYAEVVLTDVAFAGETFRVYFQMDKRTRRLAHVLLERRRQYATPAIFAKVLATLGDRYGSAALGCDRGSFVDRFWQASDETIEASFLGFAGPTLDYLPDQYDDPRRPLAEQVPLQNVSPDRRLVVRYSPATPIPKSCK